MNTYKLNFASTCPNDNAVDNYKLTIKSKKIIMVEDILEVVAEIKKEAKYQEEIHDTLKKNFPEAKIKMVGWHLGIEITTKC